MFYNSVSKPRSSYQGIPDGVNEPKGELSLDSPSHSPSHSSSSFQLNDLELGEALSRLELEPNPDDEVCGTMSDQRRAAVSGRVCGSMRQACSKITASTTAKTATVGALAGTIAGAVIGAAALSKIHGQTPQTGALWGMLAVGSTGAAAGLAVGLALSGCPARDC
jgi:hypothetical protein